MREPSHSVFIQSDTEQRSTIVQAHWCCQSAQGDTAGGGRASLTHTDVNAKTLTSTSDNSQALGWLALRNTLINGK